MSIHTEHTFESALVQSLLEQGGYTEGNASDYSPELGLFKDEVIQFLEHSQPKKWKKISSIHGVNVKNRIIQRLYKELDLRGSLDVMRKGFVDYGVRFQIAFFRPRFGLESGCSSAL